MAKYNNDLNGYFENGRFITMSDKIAQHRENLIIVKNTLQSMGQGHLLNEPHEQHICNCDTLPCGHVSEPTDYNYIDFIKIILKDGVLFIIGFIIGRMF